MDVFMCRRRSGALKSKQANPSLYTICANILRPLSCHRRLVASTISPSYMGRSFSSSKPVNSPTEVGSTS